MARKVTTATTQAPAVARMHGQWLYCRSRRGPRKAVTTQAANGRAGIIHRMPGTSDMAFLGTVLGFESGGRQTGRRWLGRRGRQRLVVQRRLLTRLAQLLPEADIERATATEQHEDQCQRNRRLARRHRQDEQCEHLSLEITTV